MLSDLDGRDLALESAQLAVEAALEFTEEGVAAEAHLHAVADEVKGVDDVALAGAVGADQEGERAEGEGDVAAEAAVVGDDEALDDRAVEARRLRVALPFARRGGRS